MNEVQQKTAIHFLVLKGKASKDIYEELVIVLGNSALVFASDEEGQSLQGEEDSIEDNPCPRCPSTTFSKINAIGNGRSPYLSPVHCSAPELLCGVHRNHPSKPSWYLQGVFTMGAKKLDARA